MTEQTQIGRYQLEEFLGSGSYAVVYRARDTLLQRVVALKVLKPLWARDREVSERFLREAQAAANLIHPHIAWVYDIGEDNERKYIAARFIAGIPLDSVLNDQGAMPFELAMQVLHDIGSGLDYAHSQGIIHRDVKPQNILLSEQEGAVLTDFGLTKAIHESTRLTQPGSIVGTPQYIPPEIWNGEAATPAVDQYAMGCIFFEMLTGKMLFEGRVIETLLQGQLNPRQLLGSQDAELPSGIFDILNRALAPRPENRFPSLSAFVEALQKASQSHKPMLLGEQVLAKIPEEDYGEAEQSEQEPSIDDRPVDQTSELAEAAETKSLEFSSDPIISAGSLDDHDAWRSKFQQVYRRINPLSAGKLRAGNTYRLIFTYSGDDMDSGDPGETLVIDREKVIIGRSSECDVVVDYPDISRQHASLIFTGAGCLLKDLRSTNGTFLNDERVIVDAQLSDGDVIRLGSSVKFIYKLENG